VTGLVDTNNTIWTCYIQHAISSTKKTHLNWAGQRYNLVNLVQKKKSAESIKEKLKAMPHTQMKSELKKVILDLDVNPNYSFENSKAYRMLNSYDIKIMVDSGLIEFGAHSNSHAILSHLSYDEQKEEIKSSITAVQKMTGKKCTLFAFPNGSENDFNDDTIDILNSSGIISSVTSIEGYNKITTPIMKLKRHGIGYGMGMIKFKLLVHEFISILKKTEKMDL
jgi:peptidoglycan/xylan/chitin deacetylase (PgdA/CDA1 family)